jgi:hypothetical protein
MNVRQRHDGPWTFYKGVISCPLNVKCNYFSASNFFLQFELLVTHCVSFPLFFVMLLIQRPTVGNLEG